MPKAQTGNQSVGILIEGASTTKVLKSVWNLIHKYGGSYRSQRGLVKALKGVVLVINNPLDESENYPYWNQKEDNWYQDNFVRKETNHPPEILIPGEDIYTYRYAERSRYFDGGLGYIKGVIDLFRSLGINKIDFQDKSELVDLLYRTYKYYHPERVLAVLAWKRQELLNFYLHNPRILDLELQSNRRDTLLSVIEEIKQNPNSRRAITPSFIYEHIDHSGAAGGIPVYQNYQLYVNFNPQGEPEGLISLHLHRAMDAVGGTQLDISHDREWGQIASNTLGLPLQKIVIYSNDLYHYVAENGVNNHLTSKTDVRSWLFAVTDSYDPKTEDIEKRIASEVYQTKIAYTGKQLQKEIS